MNTTVTTETDLFSGQQTFEFALNPVPISTPIGLAPGVVRVRASRSGAFEALELLLKPSLVAFRGALDRLAKQADWELPLDELRRIGPKEQPVVHLVLTAEALAQVETPIKSPADLTEVLNHPAVQSPQHYRVDTITTEV